MYLLFQINVFFFWGGGEREGCLVAYTKKIICFFTVYPSDRESSKMKNSQVANFISFVDYYRPRLD